MMKKNKPPLFWFVFFFPFVLFIQTSWAGQAGAWQKNIENRPGGYLRFEGRMTGYDSGSYFDPGGTDTGLDGLAGARLTDKLSWSPEIYGEIHYEVFANWGDTHEKLYNLAKNAVLLTGGFVQDTSMIDRRRLFDLTKTIKETDDMVLWHRLDRLLFSVKPSWGDVIVGRQAVTWGNGLIFNPMDLFNPFSPSDIVRDYKTGDDLVSVRINTGYPGEINLLYVPRRDVLTGKIDSKSSSVAGKFHFFAGDIEMDIMGGLHYNEIVLGLGTTGYLGDAAWRSDLVWSTLEGAGDEHGYFEFVANIDYSWVWFKKNLYGLMEYYYNGLGRHNYTDALGDPDVLERIDRGELFALGKNYLCGRVQMELHPLFSVYLGVITNVKDPSGIIQPWAVWNLTQNSTLLMGANIYYGKKGSEYGGFLIPGTSYHTNSAANAYIQLTYYF